ncbi:hypothetical protein N8D56_22510 [Devosia sp. A8/3-2]|nr:hypothetical protein N8D56_22510 [Devosia sp. A8/3-2]
MNWPTSGCPVLTRPAFASISMVSTGSTRSAPRLLTNFRNRSGDSRVRSAGGTEQHRRLLDRIADTPLEQVEPPKHPNFW